MGIRKTKARAYLKMVGDDAEVALSPKSPYEQTEFDFTKESAEKEGKEND